MNYKIDAYFYSKMLAKKENFFYSFPVFVRKKKNLKEELRTC